MTHSPPPAIAAPRRSLAATGRPASEAAPDSLAGVRLRPLLLHALGGIIALTCAVPRLTAQARVPADLQAAILTRMLSYDRALQAAAGRKAIVGILAKAGDRSSGRARDDLAKAIAVLQSGRVPGKPLAVVSADYANPADLTAWLASKGVHVLYVEAALEKELDEILEVCASTSVLSVAADRAFVERGIAVGIVLQGERPAIVINLPVAKALGMDPDPKLLELAEILE